MGKGEPQACFGVEAGGCGAFWCWGGCGSVGATGVAAKSELIAVGEIVGEAGGAGAEDGDSADDPDPGGDTFGGAGRRGAWWDAWGCACWGDAGLCGECDGPLLEALVASLEVARVTVFLLATADDDLEGDDFFVAEDADFAGGAVCREAVETLVFFADFDGECGGGGVYAQVSVHRGQRRDGTDPG